MHLGDHDVNVAEETQVDAAVASFSVHPNYNGQSLDNDLAILTLEQPIDFASNAIIRPGCLPSTLPEVNSEVIP